MADETSDNEPVTAESADSTANEPKADQAKADEAKETDLVEVVDPTPAESAADTADEPEKPAAAIPASAAPEAKTEPAPERGGRRAMGLGLAAVALLAVVATVFAVFFGIKYSNEKDLADAKDNGTQFACSFAKSLVTYDFNNLDQFFRNVLDETSGALQSDFQGAKAEDLKQRVIASQSKSTPADANCGLISGDKNKAQVVVTLTQNVTSTGTKGQTVVMPPAVMIITATNSGGHWTASDLQPIGLQQ